MCQNDRATSLALFLKIFTCEVVFGTATQFVPISNDKGYGKESNLS